MGDARRVNPPGTAFMAWWKADDHTVLREKKVAIH
jgi:hypothetical protein